MKLNWKLERQPWQTGDASPKKIALAFGVLIFAIFAMPLVMHHLLGKRLAIGDILLLCTIPGLGAYGFFTVSKLPLRGLQLKDGAWFILLSLLTMLTVGGVNCVWQAGLTALDIPFEAEQSAVGMVRDSSGIGLWKLFFALCVFTPLIEELLFRRIVYGFLLRFGFWKAFFGTALLFSVCHFFIGGVGGLFILGMGFQLMYLRFRNLGASVLLHALINASAFFISI